MTTDERERPGEEPDISDGTVFSGKTIRFPTPNIAPEEEPSDAPNIAPNEEPNEEPNAPEPNADLKSNESEESDGAEERESFLSFFGPPSEVGSEEDRRFRKNFRSFFEKAGESDDDETLDADDGGNDGDFSEDDEGESDDELSYDEMVQRSEDEALAENLDAMSRENDRSALYTLGEKYGDAPFETSERLDGEETVEPTPLTILEAMLFVGDRENRPLVLGKAAELMRNVSEAEAREAIDALNRRYELSGAPYRVVEEAGNGETGGWRLALCPEFAPVRERFLGKVKEFRLSQRAIDLLALVAYRQPISLAEIQADRTGTAPVLAQLVKRGVIAVEKKTVEKKQVSYYRTTDRFLKLLGINSLDDLPIVDEIDYR